MILRSLLFAALVWLGPDGTPLPFGTSEEVAGFLRESKVVEVTKKLRGTTRPEKVVVENGGVRANAVFRSFHKVYYNAKWDDGRFTGFLRDSYRNEIAAYELSRLLELDTVPPTVFWSMGGRKGSLQLWIENAQPGYNPLKEARQPPDPERWIMERAKMRAFDALIENIDRNVGNMLIDSTGKVWWIDHTRAFGHKRDPHDAELITRCERHLFERLKAAEPEEIAERMRPHMKQPEIDALLERRLRLIALIEKRIAAHGEAAVLFSLEADKEVHLQEERRSSKRHSPAARAEAKTDSISSP